MSLLYPVCYMKDSGAAIPAPCDRSKEQLYVRYGFMEPRELITSWVGDIPISDQELERAGHYGPQPQYVVSTSNGANGPGFVQKTGEFLQNLLDVADRSQKSAVKLGYVAVFAIGAGLLVWYVPRKS